MQPSLLPAPQGMRPPGAPPLISAFAPSCACEGKSTAIARRGYCDFVLIKRRTANPEKTRIGGIFAMRHFYADSIAPPIKPLRVDMSALPGENDSALQPEAVLIIVVAADRQGAVVAKARVEIFSLD